MFGLNGKAGRKKLRPLAGALNVIGSVISIPEKVVDGVLKDAPEPIKKVAEVAMVKQRLSNKLFRNAGVLQTAVKTRNVIMNLPKQMALVLRVAVLYPLAGVLAGYFGFTSFDPETGQLVVDLQNASELTGAAIYTAVGGGTFAWSRFMKKRGGAT